MDGPRILPLVLVAVLAATSPGCTERSTAPGEPVGAVRGTVLAGPTCPVETSDGAGCEPTPVLGSVEFWHGDTRIVTVTIEPDGTFAADVPTGTHVVRVVPAGASGFPICQDTGITVAATGTPPIEVLCDTGIR